MGELREEDALGCYSCTWAFFGVAELFSGVRVAGVRSIPFIIQLLSEVVFGSGYHGPLI